MGARDPLAEVSQSDSRRETQVYVTSAFTFIILTLTPITASSCDWCFCLKMPILTVSVLGGLVQKLTTNVDRVPDEDEIVLANKFNMHSGKGCNSAVATYRLTRLNPKNRPNARNEAVDDDFRVRMVGAVGEDEFGLTLIESLAKNGINVDGVRILKDESTAVANILVEAGTGANRIMLSPGAGYALKPTDFVTLESLGGGVAPDFVIISQVEIRRDTIEQVFFMLMLEGCDFRI